MIAIGSVTSTQSPSSMNFFLNIPSDVDSMSILVLSVSTAKKGSPFLVSSPSFLYHFTIDRAVFIQYQGHSSQVLYNNTEQMDSVL